MGHSLGSYTYQSNGWCYDHCNTYAFGIVQSDKCWCSNYAPAKTVDVSTFCNKTCPGYPTDLCGDKDAGYFGYIPINGVRPSGTMNPSSAATVCTYSTVCITRDRRRQVLPETTIVYRKHHIPHTTRQQLIHSISFHALGYLLPTQAVVVLETVAQILFCLPVVDIHASVPPACTTSVVL